MTCSQEDPLATDEFSGSLVLFSAWEEKPSSYFHSLLFLSDRPYAISSVGLDYPEGSGRDVFSPIFFSRAWANIL
jgi:hypothetical protein